MITVYTGESTRVVTQEDHWNVFRSMPIVIGA